MSDQIMKSSADTLSAAAVARARAMDRANASAIFWRRARSGLLTGLVYLFLIIMTIFALFPLYFVLQASLAGAQNLYTTDLRLLPVQATLDNYVVALTQQPLLSWLMNTLFVCGTATVLGVAFAATGAYALARFRFRGRELSLVALLAIQTFPALLALQAYYLLLLYLRLNGLLIGLTLIYTATALAFSTWNIKGYYDTIPVELEQAALVDGATTTQAFLRVTLPLAAPALAASALLFFIGTWNEFAIANYVLNANSAGTNLTFALGLNGLQSDFRTPWGIFAATSVIVSIPLMTVFLLLQRYFRSGLTVGSVKG